jgi:RHS repeat-associated protein
LALKTDGTVWAWGHNNSGQLGNGTTSAGGCSCSDTSVQVSGLSDITALAGSGSWWLALRSDGTVWAWGNNQTGNLGTGTLTTAGCDCIDTPVQVSGLTGVTALSAAYSSALALKSDGTVWSWGDDYYGEVGNGTTMTTGCNCVDAPVELSLSGVVAVSSGATSFALKSDGTVWSWGDNGYGELGNGTTGSSGCYCVDTPVQVSGLTDVRAVPQSGSSVFALRADGTVWAWGLNNIGELGIGTTSNSNVPVQVGNGLADVTSVSMPDSTAYAIQSNGAVWAWGDNNVGQLGNGTTTTTGCQCSDIPVPVSTPTDITSVSSEDAPYASSFAVRADGSVWAWGDTGPDLGLGLSGFTPCCVDAPEPLNGPVHVTTLSVTHYHTLALTSSGTLWAWGRSTEGQLGNGSTDVVDSPVEVMISGVAQPPSSGQERLAGGPVVAAETGSNCACADPKLGQSYAGDPVDTGFGNLTETAQDVSVPGRGIPLQFNRTYNSLKAGADGPLGYGWLSNVFMSLSQPGGTGPVTITQETGAQAVFDQNGSTYTPAAPRDIATLTHNADGSWTLVRKAQQSFTFSASGVLTSERDRNGYTTSFTYNASSQLTTISDQAGRSLSLGWTGSHLTSLTDGNVTPARQVAFAYNDGAGNLTDVTDVDGGHTHFTYDASHRITNMYDPNCSTAGSTCNGGQGVIVHYNGSGEVDWQQDQLGRATSFSYSGDPTSAIGSWTTITDPKGNVRVDHYQYGVLTSETSGSGTASAATWSYTYDPTTVTLLTAIDPNGNTSYFFRDAAGNQVSATDPLGRGTAATYNTFNEPLTVTDPLGVTTTYTYDANGDLTQISRPLLDSTGHVLATQATNYQYGDASHPGDVTAMIDPDGRTWTYSYDADGDLQTSTDPLNHTMTTCYNAIGWQVASYSAKAASVRCSNPPPASPFETEYSYVDSSTGQTNQDAKVATVTDPLGHVTRYHYDADRNVTSVIDADGNTTTYVFDLANEQTAVKRADGTELQTDYNADGTVHLWKDGNGNAIQTYGYDPLARVTSATDALGNTTRYGYDLTGNETTQQDAGGNCGASPAIACTTMAYDADNELSGITYSDGITPNVSGVSYDGDGQRTGMSDGTGTCTWTYDSLRRLTKVSEGSNGSVSYQYDLRGSVTQITYPSSHAVARGYDAAGRWTSTTDWLGNTVSFGYDADSDLATETYPANAAGSYDQDQFGFNAADQMSSDNVTKVTPPIGPVPASTATLSAATYSRDANGQLVADTSQPPQSANYAYTQLKQLCAAGAAGGATCTGSTNATTYAYDAGDNLVQDGTTAQAFNAADELCWTAAGASPGQCGSAPTGATQYQYDNRENRSQVSTASGVTTTLGYDQANRLVTWQQGSTSASYAYTGDGLRMSKTLGGTRQPFAWDLTSSVPLLLSDGSNEYVYGPSGLPVEQVATSSSLYFHHDQIGSTRELTDANGLIQATYQYNPYGNLSASTGQASTPFKFQGQYKDSESGLYYLRARYYDPTTGQFLSVDPAVGSTHSPFGYAGNNPLASTDPTGLDNCGAFSWFCDAVATGAQAVGGGLSTGAGWVLNNISTPAYSTDLDPNSRTGTDLPCLEARAQNQGTGSWLPYLDGAATVAQVASLLDGAGEALDVAAAASRFSGDQEALIQLAQDAKRSGVSMDEANALQSWAKEYDLSFRGPEIHPNRPIMNFWHIHVGSVDHIPVEYTP